MGHGSADLDACWVTIRDESPCFAFEDLDKIDVLREITSRSVDCRGELPGEACGERSELGWGIRFDDEGEGAEHLLGHAWVRKVL